MVEDNMPMDHHSFGNKITRRSLVTGAAAGTLALATDPASAQRCSTPTRTKGPLVWLDMDQQGLDDAYDQDVYAFNTRHINDRRIEANATALSLIGQPER